MTDDKMNDEDILIAEEVSKKLAKQIKDAKKLLKQMTEEREALEILSNCQKSMGAVFSGQAALEYEGSYSDSLPEGFIDSEEYASALTAYKKRLGLK